MQNRSLFKNIRVNLLIMCTHTPFTVLLVIIVKLHQNQNTNTSVIFQRKYKEMRQPVVYTATVQSRPYIQFLGESPSSGLTGG